MAIHVDFACNDPDNGDFVGKFHMMQVRAGDDDLEFEGPWNQLEGITFGIEGDFARVGRIKVPILGSKAWVGNWCWDSIAVRWPEALRIINYVGKNQKQGWHMNCGPTDLFDAFNERHEITPLEWKASNERRHP